MIMATLVRLRLVTTLCRLGAVATACASHLPPTATTIVPNEPRKHNCAIATGEHFCATVDPREFGWPARTSMVVIDLSCVPEAETQWLIVAAARSCWGCLDVRARADKPLLGVRLLSSWWRMAPPENVERAIRRRVAASRLAWIGEERRYLRVDTRWVGTRLADRKTQIGYPQK
jgi:hypothetical protein